mgnify:CR=1 FL=1
MILLEELIYEQHVIGSKTMEGESIPILSFSIPNLSEFAIVLNSSSDADTESYSAGKATIIYPSEVGDVLGEQFFLVLGEYQAIKVAAMADTFSLRVDVSFWLEDLRLKIWKGTETMALYPLASASPAFPTANNVVRTSTAAAAAATNIAAAPAAGVVRVALTVNNNSTGTIYVRFDTAAVGAATAAAWDVMIPPLTAWDWVGPGLPRNSGLNAIATVASGVTLSGNIVVVEGTT